MKLSPGICPKYSKKCTTEGEKDGRFEVERLRVSMGNWEWRYGKNDGSFGRWE